MKKLLVGIAMFGLLAGLMVAPATAKKGGPVVVGTDLAGDWGANVDPGLAPVGDATGQDLVGAEIGMADAKTVNFVIKLNSLPPSGGIPEFVRYTWDFTVDGKARELDGKFTNYTRGACDPTSGQCDPATGKLPRDPGLQPFLVRGECTQTPTAATTLTFCEELDVVQATFDAATASITIPVSLEALGAKPGSKIVGAIGTFSAMITASPAAFLTSSGFPMDGLITLKTFTVPR
ncbi:MAG: hypothetical protein QOG04_1013 [Actinomycetota bacterium]|jgi:hypothetical protein|nr:hypothetical protein [Actinomycetota bacterium]